jgi:hypothetical protein
MPDTRYFGIALTFEELHKALGLPEDVKLHWVEVGGSMFPTEKNAFALINLSGPGGRYDGASQMNQSSFFRPDISTRKVSQVVIHPLKER